MKRTKANGNPVIGLIFAIILTTGAGIFTASHISKSKRCTVEVDATVCATRDNSVGDAVSYIAYGNYTYGDYNFNNVELGVSEYPIYGPYIISIMVNPDNPNEFFVPGTPNVAIYFLVFGIVFLIGFTIATIETFDIAEKFSSRANNQRPSYYNQHQINFNNTRSI